MLFLGDSFDFPLSPTFSLSDLTPTDSPAPVDTPQETLDLSSIGHAPTRHLARVATTTAHAAVSLQRVGSIRLVTGPVRASRCTTVLRSRLVTCHSQAYKLYSSCVILA
jgi:X box-binding protein 1